MEPMNKQSGLNTQKLRRKIGVITEWISEVTAMFELTLAGSLGSVTNNAVVLNPDKVYQLHQNCGQKEKRRCHLTHKYTMRM